jgi:uncharacterized phage protein (TIGR01671 family)
MNDRLKFRMWDGYSGKYFNEETDPLFENVYECMRQQIFFDSGNTLYGRLAYNHAKDGRIFEQCTGLKDKNGKLIYENDIIDTPNGVYRVAVDDFGLWTAIYKGNPLKDVVEWSDIVKNYAFNRENVEIVILGNVHKNKELLDD